MSDAYSPPTAAGHTAYYLQEDGAYAEHYGLDFEQMAVGQRYVHRPGLTLSQQDNVDEALDSCNAAMLHYDARYAAQTSWQRPLMVSTLTLQAVLGMTSRTLGRRRRITDMASIRLSAPVFGGDTLYAETEVLALAPLDGEAGQATLRTRGVNQDGVEVVVLEYRAEIWRAGAGPDQSLRREPAPSPRFAAHHVRGDGAWVEQVGLYFEDLVPGERFLHWPGRRILEAEVQRHALRAFEWGLADATQDGQPMAASTAWLVGLPVALTTRTFGRVSANLGWTDVSFGPPVRAGDTVRARSEVLSSRLSASRPAEGVVGVRTEALNQHGDVVVTLSRSLLVYRRGAAAPYEAAGY